MKLSENFAFSEWSKNPLYFGKRSGIATFTYVQDEVYIDVMLRHIIKNDNRAFESEIEQDIDFDSDIPF